MLVLSRKPGERIKVEIGGQEIVIALVAMRGGKARIGIEAPMECKILREEITDLSVREPEAVSA